MSPVRNRRQAKAIAVTRADPRWTAWAGWLLAGAAALFAVGGLLRA